jgi:hypothetical protein
VRAFRHNKKSPTSDNSGERQSEQIAGRFTMKSAAIVSALVLLSMVSIAQTNEFPQIPIYPADGAY